jgi:peptidoglycan/xylan/chitin deacetylase (PgdA/CDA1 family)
VDPTNDAPTGTPLPPGSNPTTGRNKPGPGLAPIYYNVPTKANVAFITIDDGLDTKPEFLADFQKLKVPVALFLISSVARRNPPFFTGFQQSGAIIEAHTITHKSMTGRPYADQKHEICQSSDDLGATFGKRPTLFRPPFGNFDLTTRRAAHDCGMKAVLHWRATVDHGKVFYQTSVHKLHPGDVVLMHFRPAFIADLNAAVAAIKATGLEPAQLENYIP